MIDLIEHESSFGPAGSITLKCNGIADDDVIDTLYAASEAGTRVDMLVRGMCCLRAGVPGLSENIRVRSVLGRFLEHSRIYRFAHGNVIAGDPEGARMAGAVADAIHLIGSADLMPRNLLRRVEVIVPIIHPRHTAWLDQALAFGLDDDMVAWELRSDDSWERIGPRDDFAPHAQERMYRWTLEQQLQGRV